MAAQIGFDVMTLTNAADLATNGTMTFNYPGGRVKADYNQTGEKMYSRGLQAEYAVGANNFSLVYGASSVVVTYLGATSIPAGTLVTLQAPLAAYQNITDSSGGAASGGLAAGVGIAEVDMFINLNDIAANGDVMTAYTPGYNFKILALDWIAAKPVTTAAKLATVTPKINATSTTGGAVALTSANSTPMGVKVAGSAVTALNTGGPTDTIGLVASGVTQFTEGNGWFKIKLQNMDTANAFAAMAAKINTMFANARLFERIPS